MEYNDLLEEYKITKVFWEEAKSIGLSNAEMLLGEKAKALLLAVRKINPKFEG